MLDQPSRDMLEPSRHMLAFSFCPDCLFFFFFFFTSPDSSSVAPSSLLPPPGRTFGASGSKRSFVGFQTPHFMPTDSTDVKVYGGERLFTRRGYCFTSLKLQIISVVSNKRAQESEQHGRELGDVAQHNG